MRSYICGSPLPPMTDPMVLIGRLASGAPFPDTIFELQNRLK